VAARAVEEHEAMSNHWWEHIDTNPLVMSGTPMVKGVPVWQVMKALAHALSVEEVTRAYPHLTTDDLQAAISYAAATCESTPR
jgi:uncharacterized protein (DUF433 family)